jgi:hypothetical protein
MLGQGGDDDTPALAGFADSDTGTSFEVADPTQNLPIYPAPHGLRLLQMASLSFVLLLSQLLLPVCIDPCPLFLQVLRRHHL